MVTTCYLCCEPLTASNRSEEHILLNALGGRLTSKDLICKACNSLCGNTSDAILANQLLYFAHQLNVKRDRGNHPKLEACLLETGDKIRISSDGNAVFRPKPPIVTKVDEKTLLLQISAPDVQYARKQLRGLKQKYPKLDLERALAAVKINRTEPGREYDYSFPDLGGPEVFLSAYRSVLNYYLLQHGDRRFVEHLFPLIKANTEITKGLIGFYYPDRNHYSLKGDEVTHSLVVVGRPKEKILFGLIEYFNVFSYLVILSENYTGEEFQASYIYDLVSNSELPIEPKFSGLTLADIKGCCDRSSLEQEDIDGIVNRMNLFFQKLSVIQGQKKRIREIFLSGFPEIANQGDFSELELNKFVERCYFILRMYERSQKAL
jgi:hypothetical protein